MLERKCIALAGLDCLAGWLATQEEDQIFESFATSHIYLTKQHA